LIHSKSEQVSLDLFQHEWQTIHVRSPASNIGHELGKKGLTDPADLAASQIASWIGDRGGNREIATTGLQCFQFFCEFSTA
jgi:hypothetical protein